MEASLAQRRRAAALVVVMLVLVGVGALWRHPRGAALPPPCAAPALRDGVLVCDGGGADPGARVWLTGDKLDVNEATARELEAIPGVGAGLAARIVAAREERGGFRSLAELDDVSGIGPKTLAKLEAWLTVR